MSSETVQASTATIATRAAGSRAGASPLAGFVRRTRRNVGAMVGLTIVLLLLLLALFGSLVQPFDPYAISLPEKFLPPSVTYPMGTDDLGRDILSRVIEGTRISTHIAMMVLMIAVTLGSAVGLLAGYRGGWIDEITMRLADMFLAFPSFLLAMAIVAALGPGIENAILAIGISWWPRYARLLRGQVMTVKHEQYVDASRALGASGWRLVGRHILPNAHAPLLVQAASDAGQAIIVTASLSFVGLGAVPPLPEWGAMVAQARAYMLSYPWVGTFPGLAITVTVAGFVFLGDGLRDVLDPKLRGRGDS